MTRHIQPADPKLDRISIMTRLMKQLTYALFKIHILFLLNTLCLCVSVILLWRNNLFALFDNGYAQMFYGCWNFQERGSARVI